jgi:putative NIF3 family GTP cyclohydrolase 1 type 2
MNAISFSINLNIPSVRYTGPSEALIKTVAIIGGAGIGFETSAS